MNKLLLSEKRSAAVRVLTLCDDVKPGEGLTEAEKETWCEKLYGHIVNDESVKRRFQYSNAKDGYKVTVWEDGEKCYLAQTIRNDWGNTENLTIYVDKKEGLGDLMSIAKFLQAHLKELGNDYKGMMEDAKDGIGKRIPQA